MNGGTTGSATQESRVDRLVGLLEQDPDNLTLLSDAAETALGERRPEIAARMLNRYAALTDLPDREANLAGIAALQLKQFDKAEAAFERLAGAGAADPGLNFNLAWARAMQKNFDGALERLDEKAARALPQAAMLKVQLMHEQGRFEEAAELAREYIRLHPDHSGLMAAVSVLALDVEDMELAEKCASAAPGHPDALSTLGTLALGQERATEARDLFDRALEGNEPTPRAWVGRGLAKLLTGETSTAPADIDRGAALLEDHLGSWIASGWAYFINNDMKSSRARFEKALDIDPNFAESHGSLAVLDLLEGKPEEARHHSEVALRLDRNCYSAALAQTLLAAASGDEAGARAIFERAVNTPAGENGRTIAQALAGMGMRPG
jgi:tetratricopeptide (TPR) repeat protein